MGFTLFSAKVRTVKQGCLAKYRSVPVKHAHDKAVVTMVMVITPAHTVATDHMIKC